MAKELLYRCAKTDARAAVATLHAGNANETQKGGNLRKHLSKVAFLALVVLVANPMFAGMVPSKTAANQSLDSREADLAIVREVVSTDGVAQALAAQGYSRDEIDSRLAALSSEDLRSLAQNLEQIQAAGLTREQWWWVLIGAAAVLLIIVLSGN